MKSLEFFQLVALAAITFAPIAHAGDSFAHLREILLKNHVDDGLAPMEQYLAGKATITAAVDAHDPLSCSQLALKKRFPKVFDSYATTTAPGGAVVSLKPMLDDAVLQTGYALLLFQSHGDPLTDGHTVCVGMNDYPKPNAVSYGAGYIMIDPRVIFMIRQVPNYTKAAEYLIYLHEFGHQFQYWTPHYEFNHDVSARRTELAADCVGAGLLMAMWAHPKMNYPFDEAALRSAAATVGDYGSDETHHGTPAERAQAAQAGYAYVKQSLAAFGSSAGLTASSLLQACNNIVNQIKDPLKH